MENVMFSLKGMLNFKGAPLSKLWIFGVGGSSKGLQLGSRRGRHGRRELEVTVVFCPHSTARRPCSVRVHPMHSQNCGWGSGQRGEKVGEPAPNTMGDGHTGVPLSLMTKTTAAVTVNRALTSAKRGSRFLVIYRLSDSSQQPYMTNSLISILHLEKLRNRKTVELAEGYSW